MGGEELKWHQLAHNQLMSPQGPHFSPYSTAKTNFKAQISGVSSGISDVAFISVSSEKTRMKKCWIMISTRKMVPITGQASSFFVFLEFSKTKQRWGDRTTKTDLSIYSRL